MEENPPGLDPRQAVQMNEGYQPLPSAPQLPAQPAQPGVLQRVGQAARGVAREVAQEVLREGVRQIVRDAVAPTQLPAPQLPQLEHAAGQLAKNVTAEEKIKTFLGGLAANVVDMTRMTTETFNDFNEEFEMSVVEDNSNEEKNNNEKEDTIIIAPTTVPPHHR